jgi:hypothetical protein
MLLVKDDDDVEASASPNWIMKKGIGEISMPKPPDDWKPGVPDTRRGEPAFEFVDNPGDWPEYTFKAKFKKTTGPYLYHALPTGAQPVPESSEGKRVLNGWEFHYQGWEPDLDKKRRNGASQINLFPEERKGYLDYELLKKMGLTKKRIVNCDPLFFKQLLQPMCDPEKSGIQDDPRLPYYSEIEKWTAKYAASIGLFGSYGHDYKTASIEELVHWDHLIIKSGVNGGISDGAIYRRWKTGGAYCPEIAKTMTYHRYLQIKRSVKLCDNDKAPKKGQPGYCPAYKYDYAFKAIIGNLNAITAQAGLDQCGDETTIGFNGYGERGSDLVKHVKGKPHITKGMQIALIADVHRNRPRAYCHRHKVHATFPNFKALGWTKEGPCEVRRILEKITPLIKGQPSNGLRQIFPSKPHTTWDNHFSGDVIFDYCGANEFPVLMTVRRDRLPGGVPSKHWCKEKTSNGDRRARVGRFNQPITAVKTTVMPEVLVGAATSAGAEEELMVPSEPVTYTRVHCSFQSTSSCNIHAVNSLNGNSRFVQTKERGRGMHKRSWVIEMNEARQLYLATYGRIDTIDQQLSKCNMYYRSWKYWHAAKLHADALAIVIAYDLYRECATEQRARQAFGIRDNDECVLMDFHTFRDCLGTQGLTYSVIDCKYPGDSYMRAVTKMPKNKRPALVLNDDGTTSPRERGRPPKNQKLQTKISVAQLANATTNSATKGRLCGDLCKLIHHEKKMETTKHEAKCAWCGDPAYTRCAACEDSPHLHHNPRTGKNKGKKCFYYYHNTVFFGLAREDMVLLGKKRKDWKEASKPAVRANARHIAKLEQELDAP